MGAQSRSCWCAVFHSLFINTKHSYLCDYIYICVTIETGAPQGRHARVPPAPSADSGGLSGAAAAAAAAVAAARLQLASATHNTKPNDKKTHDGFFFFFFFFSRTCPLHSSRASPSSSAAQWAPAAMCSQVHTPNITTGFMYKPKPRTGTDKGMAETFGSTCHGAGRALSRNKSRNALECVKRACRSVFL